MARMRYVKEAVKELKMEDPNTRITEHFLRQLIKTKAVKSVPIGNNRRLINYDDLLAFLEDPDRQMPIPEEESYGCIRRIG